MNEAKRGRYTSGAVEKVEQLKLGNSIQTNASKQSIPSHSVFAAAACVFDCLRLQISSFRVVTRFRALSWNRAMISTNTPLIATTTTTNDDDDDDKPISRFISLSLVLICFYNIFLSHYTYSSHLPPFAK